MNVPGTPERPRKDHGPVVLACAMAATILLLRLVSPGTPEIGDGALHYLQAAHAWEHPAILFDHWAKPLYVLLGSPFAQLGHWGMALFNAVLAACTAGVIMALVRRQQAAFAWAVPVVLMPSVQYYYMVFSGMTEILFGLLAVCAVGLLLTHRYGWGLLVASFMPVSRPEYMAVLPVLVAWVAWRREWKALPWALTGIVLYSLLGWHANGDPLWLFTKDPYRGHALYGQGDAWHFLRATDEVLGRPLKWAVCAAVLLWPLVVWRDAERRRMHREVFVLCAIPAAGIWALHSYAWWKGGNGSLGLVRVLATSTPLIVLFVLHVAAAAWRLWVERYKAAMLLFAAGLSVHAAWAVKNLRYWIDVPLPVQYEQEEFERAAERIKKERTTGARVIFLHPYVAVRAELDQWESTDAMMGVPDPAASGLGLRAGDLLQWDTHFGPNEAGIPLSRLLEDTALRVLDMIPQREGWVGAGTEPLGIWLFKRQRAERQWNTDTLFTLGGSLPPPALDLRGGACADSSGDWCAGADEFPLTLDSLTVSRPGVLADEIVVTGRYSVPDPADSTGLFLVFTERLGEGNFSYYQVDLRPGAFELRTTIPHRGAGVVPRLYFWNVAHKPFTVEAFTIVRRSLRQR